MEEILLIIIFIVIGAILELLQNLKNKEMEKIKTAYKEKVPNENKEYFEKLTVNYDCEYYDY